MAGKNTAAFGIYPSRAGVETAVDALRTAGFRNTDVSVLYPENVGSKDLGHVKATKAPERAKEMKADHGGWSKLGMWASRHK